MVNSFVASRDEGRVIAKIYGYVALGLLLTACVALGVGAVVAKTLVGANAEGALTKYYYLILISGIALIVDAIVMRVVMLKNNHSGWIPYIIYCSLFGIFLSTFVVAGIPFYILGEAFGISALVFVALFLIGYFSPINLNVVTTIGFAFLFGILIMGLFFGVMYLLAPSVFQIYYVLLTGGILVFMVIVIAADSYNIRRIISSGCVSDNIILYCASTLYNDFIYIFIRVVYILVRLYSRSKN